MSDVTNRYMELIAEFPLRPLQNRAIYEAAVKQLEKIVTDKAQLSLHEAHYVDVLRRLIADFRERQIPLSRFNGLDSSSLVQKLMEENNLSKGEMAKIANIQPQNFSAFLSGRRNLPNSAAERLGEKFGLSPLMFSPRFDIPLQATIYCNDGPLAGGLVFKFIIERLEFFSGKYENEPFTYYRFKPPYIPVFNWYEEEPFAAKLEDRYRICEQIERAYGAFSQLPNQSDYLAQKDQLLKIVNTKSNWYFNH